MFYIENENKIVLFDEDKQKLQNTISFMPQYQGFEIKEVEEGYVIYDFELMTIEEMEKKEAQAERERIAKLKLTKREVFLGLYQAKGVTPEMIKAQITDSMALIEFEYANDYFRGNPLIDIVGGALGITPEQLDKFFETNDFTYLLPSEQVEDTSNQVTDQVEVQDENTTDTEQPTDVSNEVETKTTDEPNAN